MSPITRTRKYCKDQPNEKKKREPHHTEEDFKFPLSSLVPFPPLKTTPLHQILSVKQKPIPSLSIILNPIFSIQFSRSLPNHILHHPLQKIPRRGKFSPKPTDLPAACNKRLFFLLFLSQVTSFLKPVNGR